MRLWVHESSSLADSSAETYINPLPWQRKGPGIANDGRPRFDLSKFNQPYFDRLRHRIIEAGKRGIYVSVMFFNQYIDWSTHPFHGSNNINGVDGDRNKDGKGDEIRTLSAPDITEIQKSYIKKVIDTVSDLDNVLYEIANEARSDSLEWQHHMIEFIRDYEATKAKKHPVGMTSSGGISTDYISNLQLFSSPAEWISLRVEQGQDFAYDPPAADGTKVVISDSDHLSGILENPSVEWVWKSFLRGLNPVLMDVVQNRAPGIDRDWNDPKRSSLAPTRKAMGHTLSYAKRMDLSRMAPHNELASSRYCLSNPGVEYLIYLPFKEKKGINALLRIITGYESVSVDLSHSNDTFRTEWFNPRTGETSDGGSVNGGDWRSFKAHFGGDAVLYIYKK